MDNVFRIGLIKSRSDYREFIYRRIITVIVLKACGFTKLLGRTFQRVNTELITYRHFKNAILVFKHLDEEKKNKNMLQLIR